ncbi:MAG: non-ribosomal peptide synthetase [Pseudomonadota bacterium]
MNQAKPATLAETLLQLQQDPAARQRSMIHLESQDRHEPVSYQALYDRACNILYHLRQAGVAAGSRLIIATPGNDAFLDAFWACQLGGITAVPVAVSYTTMGKEKFFNICDTLVDAFVFTDRKLLLNFEAFANERGGSDPERFASLLSRSIAANELTSLNNTVRLHEPQPDDVALIQFSSGTTGTPKGVMLTHRNLLTNIQSIIAEAQLTDQDAYLSWMPLTHDMGLIGFHLTPLVLGATQYLMPSMLFARQPLLWMTFASSFGASVLASPNFGYQHFLKALHKEPAQQFDLSNVRLIFNGAESITFDVVDRFCEALAPMQLDRAVIFPVYGLAEASLAVTFPQVHQPLTVLSVDRSALATGDRIQENDIAEHRQRKVVGVGTTIAGCQLRIVDERGEALEARTVGHIEIRGGNVSRGYFGSETLRQDEEWLDTGDLGFESDQLFIVGRSKDTILVNGVTFHATDLEALCEQAADLPAGQVACTGYPQDATEGLLVFVQHKGEPEIFLPTLELVRKALLQRSGLFPQHVLPVRTIPKTSSGKIQRHALKADFEGGAFAAMLTALRDLEASTGTAPKSQARSELELLLLDICRRSITVTEISVDDDLFDLGVASLELAVICEEIDDYFPGRLELSDFLEYTSVADLAAFLDAGTVRDPGDGAPPDPSRD